MKALKKVFSDGSAILKEWRIIGFLKGYMRGTVWEVVVSRSELISE